MIIDNEVPTKKADPSLCSYRKSPMKLLVSRRIGRPPTGKSTLKKKKVIEADKGIFDRLLSSASQSMFDDDEDHSQLEIDIRRDSEISDISIMDFSKDYHLVSALRSSEDRTEGPNRLLKRKVSFCENLIQESSNIKHNQSVVIIDNAKQPLEQAGGDGHGSDQSFAAFFYHLDQDNSYSTNCSVAAAINPQYDCSISLAVTSDMSDQATNEFSIVTYPLANKNTEVFANIDQSERLRMSTDVIEEGIHLESIIVPFPVFISPILAPPIPFIDSTASDEEIDDEDGLERLVESIQKFSLFIMNVNNGRVKRDDTVNHYLDVEDLTLTRDTFGDGSENGSNTQALETAVNMKVRVI